MIGKSLERRPLGVSAYNEIENPWEVNLSCLGNQPLYFMITNPCISRALHPSAPVPPIHPSVHLLPIAPSHYHFPVTNPCISRALHHPPPISSCASHPPICLSPPPHRAFPLSRPSNQPLYLPCAPQPSTRCPTIPPHHTRQKDSRTVLDRFSRKCLIISIIQEIFAMIISIWCSVYRTTYAKLQNGNFLFFGNWVFVDWHLKVWRRLIMTLIMFSVLLSEEILLSMHLSH